ncbi:MAG TPA: hypothetical protein VIF09_28935 [Polyangiaceae bacterium]
MRSQRAFRPSRSLFHASLFALLAGCGGSAPPPQAPPPAPTAAPVAAAPVYDLSAVPQPAGLVVSGRVAKPSASLAAVHGWTQLPMPKSEQVSELLTTEAVGALVDLDRPIDFAVSVSGSGTKLKNVAAVSAAVVEPEKAKASLAERYKLVPGDGGVLLIQGLGKPVAKGDDDDDAKDRRDSERACELAPAFGDAPVRIVCAETVAGLAELGPWLTRTATRASGSADLHVDVRMQPLQATLAEGKRLIGLIMGSVVSGRLGLSSLRDLAVAFGTDMVDFASDLEGASVDVVLGDAGATATLSVRLAGSSSTIGRMIVAHPERSGPPPAAFWQLPADSDFAGFGRGTDESLMARPRELLLHAAGDLLGEQGVKEADRKAITEAMGKLLPPSGGVYASGVDREHVQNAHLREGGLHADTELAERENAKIAMIEALLGWHIGELEEPSERIAAGLKELAAAIGKPSVGAAYRAALKDSVPPSLRLAPGGKTGLPAGSLHYVLELHTLERKAMPPPKFEHGTARRPAGPIKPILVHIFVAPDGPRTWLAFGGEESVGARLASAMGSGGAKLSSRGDLATLKDARMGSGGFFSARGMAESAQLGPLLMHGTTWGATETFEQATQLPHQGTSPILYSTTPQPGGPPAVSISSFTVSREAIEDVMALALKHGGF